LEEDILKLKIPQIVFIRFGKAIEQINRAKRRKNWRKHALVSIITLTLASMMMLFMTGVQIFANNVYITADGVTKKFFTTKENSAEILSEFGYSLGEFDRIIHGENEDGSNQIDLVRGFGVEVTVDGNTFTTGTISGETADIILTASGIEIGKYDTIITGENSITLLRGFGVDVTADGNTVTIGTLGATVGEILQRAGITMGDDDIINMPLEAIVKKGDEIIVKRVIYREKTYVEIIPYDTEIRYSNLVAIGETSTKKGVNGELASVRFEKVVDGIIVNSEILDEQRTKNPRTKIVTKGSALKTPYSQRDFDEIELKNGLPTNYLEKISGKSTAYTAGPRARTASGIPLEIGTIAVDPKVIPYGSLVYIVTSCGSRVYGAAVAADTGGFVSNGSGTIVDVYMGLTSEHYNKAIQWGARNVDIYIISKGR
jgi:3D (Asp-Asp-Asp) domain-containing protein